MEEVSFNIHQYDDHIILEVITDDGEGNVTARSAEFEIEDTDRGLLTPRGDLPSSNEADILDHLQDAGYSLAERQTA